MFGLKTKREIELERQLESMLETNNSLTELNKKILRMNDALIDKEIHQIDLLGITTEKMNRVAKDVKTVLAVCDKYDEYLRRLMIEVQTKEQQLEPSPRDVALGTDMSELHTSVVTLHMEGYRFMFRESLTKIKEELKEFLTYTGELKEEVRQHELFKPEDYRYPRT